MDERSAVQPLDWLSRRLVFFMGKGGVGRTTLAHAAAERLALQGKRVLLIHTLQIAEKEYALERLSPTLSRLTLTPALCFREYIILKLRLKPLYTAFLGSTVTQYLEKAAPGVKEMVLLGKIWFERSNYDHVIVDMPSTGYALTMLHTPFNFSDLFPGGPIYRDAMDMIGSFSDPDETAFVTVTLPEEMPMQESLDLGRELARLMPRNRSWLLVNRRQPELAGGATAYDAICTKNPTLKQEPLVRALAYSLSRARKQARVLDSARPEAGVFATSWHEIEAVSGSSFDERRAKVRDQLALAPRGAT